MNRTRQWAAWIVAYLVVAYQVQEGAVAVFGESIWAQIAAAAIGIFAGWIVADAVEAAEIRRQALR